MTQESHRGRWSAGKDAAAAVLLNADVRPETKIWRYLDFAKFLSLLSTSSLYFSRIDQLDDNLEGSPTASQLERVEAILRDHPDHRSLDALSMARIARRWVYVSCWHENENEDRAMWKLYGKEDNTIAVVSTAHRLANAVLGVAGTYMFSIVARVLYIDHREDEFAAVANAQVVEPFVHKDRAYAYEKEIRALLCSEQWWKLDSSSEPDASGVMVPVVLEELIAEIVVPPGSPVFIENAVREILHDRYRLKVPVVRSRLDRPGLLD